MDEELFSQIKNRCLAYASDDYIWISNFASIIHNYNEKIAEENMFLVVTKIIISLLQDELIVYLDDNYEPIIDIDYETFSEKIRSEWTIYKGNFPMFYMTFMATETGKIMGRKIDNWRE
jgi:hypothetical protein